MRGLRVTKLIRSLQYMRIIMIVMSKAIASFIYIFFLLMLFIYIFALLGKELYANKFNFDDVDPRANFNDFYHSVLSVFQVTTLENWNDILYLCLKTSVPIGFTAAYLISMILIGNYVLLNLFLAILLEAFEKQEVSNEMQREDE